MKMTKSSKTPNKGGQPTKFDPETATKVIEKYTQGATDKEVADFIGVHENTLRNWKKASKQFLWSTQEAKEFADGLVEIAAFKRAVGFEYEESSQTDDKITTHKKFAPPDSQMLRYWLNNRKPKNWKERVEVQMDTKDTLMVVASGIKLPIKR
jgi:transposase-like protein